MSNAADALDPRGGERKQERGRRHPPTLTLYAWLMCDLHDHHGLPPLEADEFLLDTPLSATSSPRCEKDRRLGESRRRVRAHPAPVRPAALAADWLPAEYQRDVPDSGMGGGIGEWLLFRAVDRSLCLFSLVVPPGSMTPYPRSPGVGARGPDPGQSGRGVRTTCGGKHQLMRRRPLMPGDYYVLLPPTDDIHRVRTTSAETSVSIHLLANDTGCTERHTFDDRTGAARPFRSGYANAICEAEAVPSS